MSSVSSFVSYLSLIISSAVEMIGWESTKISAEQSQRGDHSDPEHGHSAVLGSGHSSRHPFKAIHHPLLLGINFLCRGGAWRMRQICRRRNVFFSEFSAPLGL